MARRQQVNTNIGTNQLQGSVQGISVPQPSVEQLRDTRADNFLKQLSTAKKGMDMVIGYGQQQAQQAYAEVQQKESAKLTEAQKALALEESKQEQIERQIKLENLKQAKINNEIEVLNAKYSADGRKRAADKRREDKAKEAQANFDKANKELQSQLKRTGMSLIGIQLPDEPQNIEAMKQLVAVGQQKEAEGFTGTNRTVNSFLVDQGITVADKAYMDEKARRIKEGLPPMSEYEAARLYQNTVDNYVGSVGGDFGDAELSAYESLQKSFGTVYKTSLDESSKFIAESIKKADELKESTRQLNFAAKMFDTKTDVPGKVEGLYGEFSRRTLSGEDPQAVSKDLAGVFEEYLKQNPGNASIQEMNSTLEGMRALANEDPEKYAGLITVAAQIDNIKEDATKRYSAQTSLANTSISNLTETDIMEGTDFYGKTVELINKIEDPEEHQLAVDKFNNKLTLTKQRYDSDQKRLSNIKDLAKVQAISKDDQALVKKDMANARSKIDFNQKTMEDENGNVVPTNFISGWVGMVSEYKGGMNATYMGGSEFLGLGLEPALNKDTATYYSDELKRIESNANVNAYELERFKEMNPQLEEARDMIESARILGKPVDYVISKRQEKEPSRGQEAYNNLSPTMKMKVDRLMKDLDEESFDVQEQAFFGGGYNTTSKKLNSMPGEIQDMARYAAAEFAYDYDIIDQDKIKKFIEHKFKSLKVTEQGVVESQIAGAEDVLDMDGYIKKDVALQVISMSAGYDWDDPEDIARFNVATRMDSYDNLSLVHNRLTDSYDIMASLEDGSIKRMNTLPITRSIFDQLHAEKNQ